MKRARKDSLTGGTGDVSPQLLSFSATQSGNDTTTTFTQPIPIQRLPSGTKAQVMEVLRVYLDLSQFQPIANVNETNQIQQARLSTTSFGSVAAPNSDPRVFAYLQRTLRGAFTAGGTYAFAESDPYLVDLTDGAGHGFLVATDNIFLQVESFQTGVANTATIKILYRWKNVSLAEYVGIVQGQQ